MPITPEMLSTIVDSLDCLDWVHELKQMAPALRKLVSGESSSPSGFSIEPPNANYSKGSAMCRHAGHSQKHRSKKHRYHRPRTPDGRIVISAERYAKKRGDIVKRMATENAARGVHVPFRELNELAERELSTGVRRYAYGSANATTERVSAGSGGNDYMTSRTGSAASSLVSSNRGTDGRLPEGVSAYGDTELASINGRLARLRRWAAEERLRLQFGPKTLEEIQNLETVEREVAELEATSRLRKLEAAGSQAARLQNKRIVDFVTANPGVSYDQAKQLLFPLR